MADDSEPLERQAPAPSSFDPLLPPQMAERAGAGAFIALGAELFTVVTTASSLGYGATRLLGGAGFSLGLFLVVVAGAELFTGNNLLVMAWASGEGGAGRLLRH